MRRTTIFLDADLEILLRAEAARRAVPMADLVREALRSYLGRKQTKSPPGAGAFDSGHTDTAARAEDLLKRTRFGGSR